MPEVRSGYLTDALELMEPLSATCAGQRPVSRKGSMLPRPFRLRDCSEPSEEQTYTGSRTAVGADIHT
jgi:hypothetical protein